VSSEEDDGGYENDSIPVHIKSILPTTTKNTATATPTSKATASVKRHCRRRRSSTRFLRLAGRFLDNDDDDENGNADGRDPDSTGAVAVSIAGNRINASNSWNLRLIENIDQFLMMTMKKK
jgi:hypothetical protein